MAIDYGSDSVVQTISEEEEEKQNIYLQIRVLVKSAGGGYSYIDNDFYYEEPIRNNNFEYDSREYYIERERLAEISRNNPFIELDSCGLTIRGHVSKPNGLLTLKEAYYSKDYFVSYTKRYYISKK